jgi:hypothetical protein
LEELSTRQIREVSESILLRECNIKINDAIMASSAELDSLNSAAKKSALRASITETIKLQYDRIIVQEYGRYNQDLDDKEKARQHYLTCKDLVEQELILELILNSYANALVAIASKLKMAVQNYPTIQDVLKMKSIFDNQDIIHNPYDNNNLIGMYRNLHLKYQKINFVSFVYSLIDLMNWQISEDQLIHNPLKAVTEVDKLYSNWKNKEYNTMMTDDGLFTSILLKGLPKSPLKTYVVTETLKYIRQFDSSTYDQYSPMPFYNYTSQLIQNHTDDTMLAKPKIKSIKSNSNNSNSIISTNQYNRPNRSNNTNQIETAAAATNVPKANSTNNSFNTSQGKHFSTEVFKSQRIMTKPLSTKVGGPPKSFPYVAVTSPSKICNLCYPEQGSGTLCSRFGCYKHQCQRCHFYGHSSKVCMQTHTLEGKTITN